MSPGLPRLPRGEREGNERREGSSQEILPISSIERISERESETIANFLPLSFREKLREILISSRDPKKSLDQARSRAAQIFGEIDRAEGGCAPNQDQKTPAGEKEHEGINFGPINGTKSAEEKTVSSGSGGQGSPTGENSTANSRCQEDDFTGNQCQRTQNADKNIWQPPTEGTLKMNVDGAFSQDSGDAAVGVVARDHLGHICLAASIVIDKFNDAEEAEACAIKEGLRLGSEYDLKIASIESDCAIAVAAANRSEALASRCWSVYKDIQFLISVIPCCKVIKTPRACNSGAHGLAKLASVSGDSHVWLTPIPDNVLDFICKGYVYEPVDE
ncbi:uncharacterized protein [Lolium perenne]|uniref:uncharacterized protein n=1 Tax=Lolium perenne TaxID=4522 RepID=UPI0021F5BEF6|nr:uncharacterized protein LOC127348924 isoform X1 [Lolium perenne]